MESSSTSAFVVEGGWRVGSSVSSVMGLAGVYGVVEEGSLCFGWAARVLSAESVCGALLPVWRVLWSGRSVLSRLA